MLKELHRLVEAQGAEQPRLIPIGERAEAIRRAFEERQLTNQQALSELETLVHQLQQAEEEFRQSPSPVRPLPYPGGCRYKRASTRHRPGTWHRLRLAEAIATQIRVEVWQNAERLVANKGRKASERKYRSL